MIRTYVIDVTTLGEDGSATGTATTRRPINGTISGVKVEYTDQASTADTTIVDELAQPILSLTNNNVGGWFYPHPEIHDNTGAELNKQTCPFTVNGYLTCTIAQSNEGTARVYILVCES